jgi:hypothetical protein
VALRIGIVLVLSHCIVPARRDKGGGDQQDDRAEEPLLIEIKHWIGRSRPSVVRT